MATGTAVIPQSTQEVQRRRIRDMLEAHKDEFQRALPRVGLTPDRLVRVVLTECIRTPKLLECSAESLVRAVLICSGIGLLPDGTLGRVWLVPYWDSRSGTFQANAQIGYQGLKELVERAGRVSAIETHTVWSCDKFHVEYGNTPTIHHVPDPWAAHAHLRVPHRQGKGDAVDPMVQEGEGARLHGVYAIAYLRDHPHPVVEIMSVQEVERIRRASKAPDSPAWALWFEEMAMVRVLRRLCKRLPQATDDDALRRARLAARMDELADAGKPQDIIDVEPEIGAALAKIGAEPRYVATDGDSDDVAALPAPAAGQPERSRETLFPPTDGPIAPPGNGAPPTTPAPTSEAPAPDAPAEPDRLFVDGLARAVTIHKQGTNPRTKQAYTCYAIPIESVGPDGATIATEFTTFSASDAEEARLLNGKQVRAYYEVKTRGKDTYRNLIEIRGIGVDAPVPDPDKDGRD